MNLVKKPDLSSAIAENLGGVVADHVRLPSADSLEDVQFRANRIVSRARSWNRMAESPRVYWGGIAIGSFLALLGWRAVTKGQ